jgi:imidazolonepropionase-like amidohydrolase
MRNLVPLVLVLIPTTAPAQTPAGRLAISHVTVIDCTGAAARPDMTVLVSGNRIGAVGTAADVPVPPGTETVDGTGKFLIPGLWDMHGHLTDATESAFPLLIMNGVTGVRDMGGELDQIDRWRTEIDRGERIGPHIVRAGPFVDGPNEAPHHLTIRTPEEARRIVHELKGKGVDFIKVHNALPRDAFFALMDEARKEHIPVAVHLPKEVTAAEASEAGAVSLEHIEMLGQSALLRKDATAKTVKDAVAENEGPLGQQTFATFVKNGTWYVPTLVAYERGFVLWSNNPRALVPRLEIHRRQVALVGAMHKAGVRIMAGSDFSDWALVPGVDLHNELALLVEAGFSPMEALQAATLSPAEFLGMRDSLGTVEAGKIADLVLLDANPLESISHTRKINAVVLGGRLLPIPKITARALERATHEQ